MTRYEIKLLATMYVVCLWVFVLMLVSFRRLSIALQTQEVRLAG